jgi:ketosteroid isomerase-like protein
MEALGLRMMRAAEAGDMVAVRDCYTDDATLWTNTTRKTLSIDEHITMIKGMRGRASNIRYLDIRITPTPDGFVMQHLVLGDLPEGKKLDIDACFIVKVRDGKIAHREEYIDSVAQAPVRG